jgi:flap endonuclease-1
VRGLGVDLGDIVLRKTISLDSLNGRTLAIDGYNTLYQFLAIIRQPDGTPLKDHSGRITSHLSGLLYRTSNLAEKGIRLVYVFDGKPPELKETEILRRKAVKDEATVKYEESLRRGDLREARKYSQMTSRLRDSMVEDAKFLLDALGIPWVQAPSEGEAQAAYMAARGDVWAVASQDHDSLLFAAPRLVRNLAVTGRRKLPRKDLYIEIEPELIELERVLVELGISREQLVDLGILIGTDFNPDGIKGIGPKKALKMLKETTSQQALENLLREAAAPNDFAEIRRIFLTPEVTEDYRLEWRSPDSNAVVKFLCNERDFSKERVMNAIEKMQSGFKETKEKKTLDSFFG